MSVLIVAGGPDPGAGLIRKMASGAVTRRIKYPNI